MFYQFGIVVLSYAYVETSAGKLLPLLYAATEAMDNPGLDRFTLFADGNQFVYSFHAMYNEGLLDKFAQSYVLAEYLYL